MHDILVAMFGSLKRKFTRWQEAGLISEEQSAAILSFEKERKSGKLVKDLGTVGIIAILLGVVSLVASNWAALTDEIKLIGHFVLNLLVILVMLRIDGNKYPVRRDGCTLLLFGLFLTFIALIGQIYQLHGDLHVTLAFWLAICTPFVWYFGRSYTVAVPWLLVFLAALFLNIGELLDNDETMFGLVASLMCFYLPVVLIGASRLSVMQRCRPGFATTFSRIGLILPLFFATTAIQLFYVGERVSAHQTVQVALMALGLFIIFIAFRPKAKTDEDASSLWYYLLVSGTLVMLPFVLPDLESDVLSAVLFVLYWIFIAWIGARIHSASLTDWAIRLVILRLFIVYIEVFGSMLYNGIGLIVSGIMLLVILRYLNRIVAVGRKLVNYEIG